MNWFDGLTTFVKIAETQSFIGAARELNTTNSVITKRIHWLEQQLGLTLLLRTTRKVSLTDAGQLLLKQIKPLLDEWFDIHARLIDYQIQPQGALTVSLPPNVAGVPSFVKLFNEFLIEYPNIKLHLTTTHHPINLMDEKIDVLIATEKYIQDPSTTVGIKIKPFKFLCVAAPDYLKKHKKIKSPADLTQHNCLIYRNDNQWEFSGKSINVSGNFHADSGEGIILSCSLGLGIAYLPDFMIQQQLKKNSLVPILKNHPAKSETLMAFYTKHDYKPRKIEVFVDFFRKNFS